MISHILNGDENSILDKILSLDSAENIAERFYDLADVLVKYQENTGEVLANSYDMYLICSAFRDYFTAIAIKSKFQLNEKRQE